MNRDQKYSQFGLVSDMLATPDVIRGFNAMQANEMAAAIVNIGRLFMTGEGSSRLFPAKSTIAHVRRSQQPLMLHTEGGRQAQEYQLADWAVLAASNSGRTSEVIELYLRLREAGHAHLYSLTAHANSKLESLATQGFVLSCGGEGAVAATKSVVEQALFYRALVELAAGEMNFCARLEALAGQFEQALTTPIEPQITEKMHAAGVIYWAGRNDGVAEELTLKTNEITRKPADYLEGTYAVHGVEEVMNPGDVVVWVDPYPESLDKFQKVLAEGVGLTVIAISSRETPFPTIKIPEADDLAPFVQMAAGWNLLVETGLAAGVNLDKPQRARKVGNEFTG